MQSDRPRDDHQVQQERAPGGFVLVAPSLSSAWIGSRSTIQCHGLHRRQEVRFSTKHEDTKAILRRESAMLHAWRASARCRRSKVRIPKRSTKVRDRLKPAPAPTKFLSNSVSATRGSERTNIAGRRRKKIRAVPRRPIEPEALVGEQSEPGRSRGRRGRVKRSSHDKISRLFAVTRQALFPEESMKQQKRQLFWLSAAYVLTSHRSVASAVRPFA